VALEDGLRPLVVEDRYREVLLVVTVAGSVEGHVPLPARRLISPEDQRAAILAELGDSLWERLLALAFTRSTRPSRATADDGGPQSVSVVVASRLGGDPLRACLESILALRTAPLEIFVADEAAPGGEVAEICSGLGVRHISVETAGAARNRAVVTSVGDVVAFTTDDCAADRLWLDGLGTAFSDPLVMAIVGYVGPLELETDAQRRAHILAGGERRFRRTTCGLSLSPLHDAASWGRGANTIFRRHVFEELGLFPQKIASGSVALLAEDAYAFYRILASGYRLLFDSGRIVWRRYATDRHTDLTSVRATAAAASAYSMRCLLAHRELDAIGFFLGRARARARRLRAEPDARAAIVAGTVGTLEGIRQAVRSGWEPGPAPPRLSRRSTRQTVVVHAEAPPLSVVIPSYNRRRKLEKALSAFAAQTYPHDRYEVVVVIDGSTDGSGDLARSLEVPYRLRVVEQENRGVAAARNRGAAEAEHPLLVFLDDDLIPDHDLLAGHATAQRDRGEEEVAFGYCPPVVEGRRLWELWLRRSWEDYYRRAADPDHQWTFMDFASANVSLRRSLFRSSGGFDEDFRRRNEERELGVRLLARGARLRFCPTLRARHELDTRFSTEIRHTREVARADVLLALKHPRVKGRLGGVAALRRPTPDGLSPRALVAYLHPEATERLACLAFPLLDLLESLRLRRHWHALMSTLLTHSYVLGLRDALPERDDLRDFVASIGSIEHDDVVPVRLEEAQPLRISPSAVSPALELRFGGRAIARVAALAPGDVWDWEALTDRVVSQALGPLRERSRFDELVGLVCGDRARPPTVERIDGGRARSR
jgi:GT2 family glycosyltransferase